MNDFNHIDTNKADGLYVQFYKKFEPEPFADTSWLEEPRLAQYHHGDFDLMTLRCVAECVVVYKGTGLCFKMHTSLCGIESDSGEAYIDEEYERLKAELVDYIQAMFANGPPTYEN